MKGLVFTYLMTYGGSVVTLFDPFVGLLIYVCFSIVRPDSLWYWSVPPGNYSRIVALSLLFSWAVRGCGNWKFGRGGAVMAALLGYFGWSILGTVLVAREADVAWGFVENTAKIVLPVVVGMTLIDSIAKAKLLSWVILVSQGYLALEFNLSYLEGLNRLKELGFGGMDNNCMAISLVTCTGLGLFLGLDSERWWQKGLAFGSVALMVHAVLFSFSRGGMFSLIIVGFVSFILIPKKLNHYLMFLAIVLLTLRLAGPEVRARFMTSVADESGQREESSQNRLDFWGYCWDSMQKRPLLGVGPDHYPIVVAVEHGRSAEAHSLWLQTGAELGFPGLFFLASFYLVCIARLFPLGVGWRPAADPWFPVAARMVVASLTGFCVAAQFVTLEGLEVPYFVTLIGASVLKMTSIPPGVPTPPHVRLAAR